MGHSKDSPEREFLSNTGLPKMNRNISNKQHNPTQEFEEQPQRQPRARRRKEIIKIRAV